MTKTQLEASGSVPKADPTNEAGLEQGARPGRRFSHAARVGSSQRLRTLLSALLKAGDRGLTTREIFDQTGSMAVHSDCHELRQNGYQISCRRERTTTGGRLVHRYRIESASSNAPSIVPPEAACQT